MSKLMPHLDDRSRKTLNLTVLQRIDACIEEILFTAAHVTLYDFNGDLNQWSRKEVEGSFFVVKRNSQPRFQFIVMNRRNTENMVEDLLGDFEFEVQVPYLLYRNAAQEVNGIWFYNAHECEEVADLFGRILGAYSKVPLKPQLRKSEFTEHEAVPMSTVIEGPFGQAFTTSTIGDGADDSSFMNFFNTAASSGHTSSNVVNSGQPYHSPAQTVDLSPQVPTLLPSPAPTLQVSLPVQSAPSLPTQLPRDSANQINNTNHPANLVKPSFFTPPASPVLVTTPVSSAILTPAPYPPVDPQPRHGTPLVQPFPPPTPPPFLTSTQIPPNSGPLSREKVHDALLMLVQDNQFIDLVYQALFKVHQS
ncbi:PREDICTED: mRNA-decapping enzyme-like protein isoform X1 [Nicotiana attenuata]|uniref:Mrna-decapping enzyme-like protein n=1 Tax=Nicotiana attenuata TaxID=49451 RepID=A0A314LDS6_NICAT|nr:PREDICTED: mRNA-decapping enzyme-like protein isoform X1 [Nicotiana attenuata]OIT39703.1 mrna-decapping enzyme-like protein [Nicotiana attenuata]